MHRYKIFLKSGETVEVLAESVVIISDKCGLRFDFLKDEKAKMYGSALSYILC